MSAFEHQAAFDVVQHRLCTLKLVLNAKAELEKCLYSCQVLSPQRGRRLKKWTQIYWFSFLDDSLSFNEHIQNLINKLKLKLGFFFRNKLFFFCVQKKMCYCYLYIQSFITVIFYTVH